MTKESTRVQHFIDVHKSLVLHDALRDLESCDPSNIPRLLHRLKGTLGTFQFRDLAEQLRKLLLQSNQERSQEQLAKFKEEAIAAVRIELETEEKIK